MTTKHNTDYSFDIQKLYLEMFLSDAETFCRCQSIFNPENFDQRLRDTAEFITSYVDDYKVMPETQIVNAQCKMTFQPVSLPRQNYDWLMNEFESFSTSFFACNKIRCSRKSKSGFIFL